MTNKQESYPKNGQATKQQETPTATGNSNKKVPLDLVGVDGNAFAIMGAFRRQAKRSGWTEEAINLVLKEAQSKDYNHLVATISDYCEP